MKNSYVAHAPDHARSTRDAGDIYRDGTYLQNTRTWHSEDSPWKARQIQELLRRNKLSPSRVCEVGCGAGEILRQLSLGTETTNYVGYELSPQAFELCKSRQSEKVQYQLRDVLQEDVYYDCLLCIDVFEHVEDYFGFLRGLKSKAQYKIFHIPLDISVLSVLRCSMMKLRRAVGHLHYFTPETALATLEECGYEIVDGFYTRSFDGLTPRTFNAKIARIPRKLLFLLSPRWAVRLLGGCSYIVLAK